MQQRQKTEIINGFNLISLGKKKSAVSGFKSIDNHVTINKYTAKRFPVLLHLSMTLFKAKIQNQVTSNVCNKINTNQFQLMYRIVFA